MSPRSAPALLPAIALVTGVGAASQLSFLSQPLLFALLGLGFALGGRFGRLLAWLALGAAVAAACWLIPERQAAALPGEEHPVSAEVVVTGHWIRGAFAWTAPCWLEVWSWRDQVDALSRTVSLELPEDLEPPPFGSRLRVRGALFASSGFANRVAVEQGRLRLRVKAAAFVEVVSPPRGVALWSHALRSRVERALRGQRAGVGLVFARALVLGDTSGIEPAWRRGFRRSGLAHLLAVSGLNVSLIAAFVLLAAFWLPFRLRLIVALVAIAGYLLLVGPMPPLLRAAAMGSLAVLSLSLRRAPHAANALAVVVMVLVLASPSLVRDLSFQLTVGATAGLILLAPGLTRRWTGLPRWLRPPLAATIAAQVATLPVVLATFHYISLAGPLVNLVAVPWAAVALAVDLVWIALAVLWPAAASAAAPLLDGIATPFTWPAAASARLLPIEPTTMGVGMATLWACAAGAVAWWPRRLLAVTLIGGIAVFGYQALAHPRPADEVSATILDVGQGDATLLRDGEHAVLVDGGGWSSGDFGSSVLVPALAAEGVEHLDAVVLTHADRDHCRGLVDLVDYLPVRELWTSAPALAEPCGRELASRPGPVLRLFARGDSAAVGRFRFAVLAPDRGDAGGDNDLSLVLMAEALGRRVLLLGDVEAAAELRLVRRYAGDLHCDLLKIAHHGSKTSTTVALLAAARPRLATISVGSHNPFGHPHPTVIARLLALRRRAVRTDRMGEIVVRWRDLGPLRLEFPGKMPVLM